MGGNQSAFLCAQPWAITASIMEACQIAAKRMRKQDAALVTEFIKDKDRESIKTYLAKYARESSLEEAHRWFRLQVLVNISREEAIWFWSEGLEEKFTLTIQKVISRCSKLLRDSDLKQTEHWYATEIADVPVLFVTRQAYHFLLEELPCNRHAILNAALIVQSNINKPKGGSTNGKTTRQTRHTR